MRLIQDRAQAREFVELVRALGLGSTPSKERWLSSVGAVASIAGSGLEWISQGDRVRVMVSVSRYIVAALTESRTEESPSHGELETALLPFLRRLERRSDESVLCFCWAVLSFRPRPYGSYATYPIHWLRRTGRLRGGITYGSIECAIVLADEAEAMFWWPDERWSPVRWDRDSQVHIEFISDDSYVVRAAAAKALGELFWGAVAKSSCSGAPEISAVFHWIQSQEQIHPGVAGPFLEGSHWLSGGLLESFPEYDFRGWFLETLRTSSSEPQLPNMTSLEFYAHEYFCADPEAIEAMLDMGRYELAVLTATEEPSNIDLLKAVLERMSKHDHPGVARAISSYLLVREEHAGYELMSEARSA